MKCTEERRMLENDTGHGGRRRKKMLVLVPSVNPFFFFSPRAAVHDLSVCVVRLIPPNGASLLSSHYESFCLPFTPCIDFMYRYCCFSAFFPFQSLAIPSTPLTPPLQSLPICPSLLFPSTLSSHPCLALFSCLYFLTSIISISIKLLHNKYST